MAQNTLDNTLDNVPENTLVLEAENKQSLTERINAALDDNNAKLAYSFCNEAIKNNPNDAKAHRHLGLLHAASDKPGTAINSGKRACTITPDDPKAWSDLGRIYAMLGQMDNAMADL